MLTTNTSTIIVYFLFFSILPDRTENGYLFMASIGSVTGIIYSIFGTFWVNII